VLPKLQNTVLEWYGKIATVCTLEILLHAIVQVTRVSLVLSCPIRNEFERLTHAIFCHFLFGLAQFLEFSSQYFECLTNGGIFL
jgi:hypothetical protein